MSSFRNPRDRAADYLRRNDTEEDARLAIHGLLEQLDAAEEILKYYSQPDTYEPVQIGLEWMAPIELVQGKHAQMFFDDFYKQRENDDQETA